jgi:hypothetical protein
MNLVGRNDVPADYIDNEQSVQIEDYPTDLSQNKYCTNNVLPTELEYSLNGPYGKYFENYNLMKKHYKDYNSKLMGILVGEILINENNQYKIRQIDSEKLFEIEKKTRQALLEFYVGRQKIFVDAFTSLVDGVESSLAEQKKREIKDELQKL